MMQVNRVCGFKRLNQSDWEQKYYNQKKIYSGMIFFTLPTSPVASFTFMPCG